MFKKRWGVMWDSDLENDFWEEIYIVEGYAIPEAHKSARICDVTDGDRLMSSWLVFSITSSSVAP